MVRVATLPAMVALALPAAAPATEVREGDVRFQVLSPSLIRIEHAEDGRFEDRPTQNVAVRPPLRRAKVRRRGTVLEIVTSAMTLRYRGEAATGTDLSGALEVVIRSGGAIARGEPRFPPPAPPDAGPPSFEVSPYTVTEDPSYDPPTRGNLGGWYRALDLAGKSVRLHDGLLSREGFYLLDDTQTALLTDEPPGFEARPARTGSYRDGYLFAYGTDYSRGLRDLRLLTGSAPLLPRRAFGVWFSRYFAYRQSDYGPLVARFREEGVPLDVLMVDTDFKSPHAWNGWNWNPGLFPDPPGFFSWAGSEGIDVGVNTHPSITADDPRFAETEQRAGRPLTPDPTGVRCRAFVSIGDSYGTGTPGAEPDCRVFDWTHPGDQDAYMALHEPFERDGADFWWLDWCCDESAALAPGLTQDAWINDLYARRARARGSRWPVLSRVGASVFDPDRAGGGIWGEHRNVVHFTGDARPTWEMLDFQTTFNALEGNVGIPYVSHDIGGFGSVTSDGTSGRHLADDLYVRWVQSGAFGSILRLHSDHGDRLPWDYPGKAQQVATAFLRLRGELVPYLYSLARRAHDTGVPIVRATYLHYPAHDEAYEFERQYLLGPHLLVAPVGTPGDPARKEVWFPPGDWIDIFTGESHRGPAVTTLSVPLERMPVFARAGAVLPRETAGGLALDLYPGRSGRFTLYEDAGDGPVRGARTTISQRRGRRGVSVRLGRARGSYPGRPARRAHVLRLHGMGRPGAISVGNRRLRQRDSGPGFSYDADAGILIVRTHRLPTSRSVGVEIRPGRPIPW
ncbi:MAG TPA: TIM-barrel domain-containing protein, partial [Thermoleophilaceae bacterium]|nr:TIM-barrel domain-containing protein [Thermoleophilaceae bacterium]